VRALSATLVAALLVMLAVAAGASAAGGKVVYVCGANLCAIDGDGSNQRQLTTDGAGSAGYSSPSMSRDGAHMIWVGPTGCCSVGNSDAGGATKLDPPHGSAATNWPRFRPDGSQVLLGTAQSGGATAFADYANPDGSNRQTFNTGFGQVAGFAPNGGYLCGSSTELRIGPLLNDSCNDLVAHESGNAVFDYRPELSPDGSLALDAVDLDGDAVNDGIFLYDAGTGNRLRQLDAGSRDNWPTFSPDGQFVLFERSGTIYKVPTSGGTATQFVAGSEPTWANGAASGGGGGDPGGGGGDPGGGGGGGPSNDPPVLKLLASSTQHVVHQHGLKLKASCPGGCSVIASATVSVPKLARVYRFTTATADLADGQTRTMKLKLPSKALKAVRKALAHHRKLVAKVRVEARNTAPTATVLTGKVHLKK
jgi:WD40-like Beta Propeller Repeat